jgi:hypothetical protein
VINTNIQKKKERHYIKMYRKKTYGLTQNRMTHQGFGIYIYRVREKSWQEIEKESLLKDRGDWRLFVH